ncbi:MAG: glycosyltransferase [Leptospiraceae bacterium]|nr:glycosyltransferase [Leptospiraceae bacterium]
MNSAHKIPAISIVIPCLNEARELPNLLDSIRAQSFQNYEIIVADAGSTDNTVELARKAGALVVPGGMPGPGRNRGAEAAQGTWLFFFDADVILPPDFLAQAFAELQENYLDLATCEFKPQSDLRLDKVLFHFANLSVKLNQAFNPRAAGFCIFITRRLFERIGGFDETLRLAEDHDLVDRASKLRPLKILKSTSLLVSVRRLEKEGRFSLIQKYMAVEKHLMTKGAIREDIVEYEFGNFDQSTAAAGSESGGEEIPKKLLDEVESKIIQLEEQYNQFEATLKSKSDNPDLITDSARKFRAGFEALGESVKILFK